MEQNIRCKGGKCFDTESFGYKARSTDARDDIAKQIENDLMNSMI